MNWMRTTLEEEQVSGRDRQEWKIQSRPRLDQKEKMMTIEQIVCTSDSICQLKEEALHCCRSADLWERKSVISLVVSPLSHSHTRRFGSPKRMNDVWLCGFKVMRTTSQIAAIIFLVLKEIIFVFVCIEFETVTNPALKTDGEDRLTADEGVESKFTVIFN